MKLLGKLSNTPHLMTFDGTDGGAKTFDEQPLEKIVENLVTAHYPNWQSVEVEITIEVKRLNK